MIWILCLWNTICSSVFFSDYKNPIEERFEFRVSIFFLHVQWTKCRRWLCRVSKKIDDKKNITKKRHVKDRKEKGERAKEVGKMEKKLLLLRYTMLWRTFYNILLHSKSCSNVRLLLVCIFFFFLKIHNLPISLGIARPLAKVEFVAFSEREREKKSEIHVLMLKYYSFQTTFFILFSPFDFFPFFSLLRIANITTLKINFAPWKLVIFLFRICRNFHAQLICNLLFHIFFSFSFFFFFCLPNALIMNAMYSTHSIVIRLMIIWETGQT